MGQYIQRFIKAFLRKSINIHGLMWTGLYVFFLHLINNVYSLGKSFFFGPWMIDIVDKKYRFNVEKAKKGLGW